MSDLPVSQLVNQIRELSTEGGNFGIVCNTVKNATLIFDELGAHFPDVTLVHSRFVGVDRLHNDAELLRRFGKGSSGSAGRTRIVVGTQVMEQSLDIDFDALFSEVAPMDLIMQRIGRCHRHGDKIRPDSLKEAQLFILDADDTDLLNGKSGSLIYGAYRIEQARRTLATLYGGSISLPEDISVLVQQSFDFHEPDMDGLRDNHENETSARKQRAEAFILSHVTPSLNAPIFGWLDGGMKDDTEGPATAKVRDGTSGPTVIALFDDLDGEGKYVPVYKDGVRKKFYVSTTGAIGWKEYTKIMGSSVTLPMNYSHLVWLLEQSVDSDIFDAWAGHKMLRDEISVLFTQNVCELAEHTLEYDEKRGLS